MNLKSYQKLICIFIFISILAARKTKNAHKATKKIHRKLESSSTDVPQVEVPGSDAPQSCKGSFSNTDPSCDPYEVNCPQDLIRSFGLDGLSFSRLVSVDACPSVVRSCCAAADSDKIFKNWSANGVEQNLNKRLDFHVFVLNDLFAQGSIINDRAIDVLRVLYTKPNTECKFMARRIAYFQAQEVFPVLIEKIKKAQSFFVKSYKGIFCAMCDASNAAFFGNKGNKQLLASAGFCRNLVSRYLNTLLYYHVHVKKFFKLASTFITTCDSQGVFRKIDVPAEAMPEINTATAAELIRCKLARNSGLWLDACKPICTKFKLDSFEAYFEPDVKSFISVTEYIKKQLIVFSSSPVPASGDQTAIAGTSANLTASAPTPAPKSNTARKLRLHNSYWNNNRVLKEEDVGYSNSRNLGAKHNKKTSTNHNKNEKKQKKRKLQGSDKSASGTGNSANLPINSTTPMTPADILKQFDDNRSVYILSKNSTVNLKDFTIDIRNVGVDLYMSGAVSDISSSTVSSANAANAVSSQAAKNRKARKLKHATILGVVVSILGLIIH